MSSYDITHADRFPQSTDSARAILPVLFKIAGDFKTSVDLGGGIGAWTRVLQESGLDRAVSIDAPGMDPDELLIEWDDFVACDLSREFPEVIRADLALCLENAEHLPPSQSKPLVDYLTSCAEVVLFSAAIPGQPSLYHINEQPHAYWKGLFREKGFRCFDCIRPHIVGDTTIPYWYRQNMFLFASEEAAKARNLADVPFEHIPEDFELIHQKVLTSYRSNPLGKVKDIPTILWKSIAARIRKH